jgi:hypothetical protein
LRAVGTEYMIAIFTGAVMEKSSSVPTAKKRRKM